MPMLLNTRNESPQPSNPSILPTFSLPPLDQLMPQFYGKDEDNPLEFLNKFQATTKNLQYPYGNLESHHEKPTSTLLDHGLIGIPIVSHHSKYFVTCLNTNITIPPYKHDLKPSSTVINRL